MAKNAAKPAADVEATPAAQEPAQEQAPAQEQQAPAEQAPAEQAPVAKPSPALDGKYQVVDTTPGIVVTNRGREVDLRTISLEEADALHATGKFQYLAPVAKGV